MGYLRQNFLLLFFFHLSSTLRGQDTAIEGKIVDSQTTLPVPFASIKIKTRMMGVVSNGNGDFQIPGKYKDLADSLVISCIGYTTTTVSFRDLHESAFNHIKIAPSVNSLTYSDEKSAFVLDFNTIPEEISVTDTSNYELTFDNKHLRIHRPQLTGERQITLFLDEPSAAHLAKYSEEMSSQLSLRTKNVRDVDNRELDKVTNSTVFQFRELFVQKIFPGKAAPANGEFINKSAPLSPEVVSRSLEADIDFWMNSPLRKKQ